MNSMNHLGVTPGNQHKNNLKSDWRVWWRLLRPHTLTASFVPVFVGTAMALLFGRVHWGIFLAMLLASILIQAATNMFNEYYDFKKGLDTAESVGIGGAIVRDGISERVVLRIAFSFYFISILLGIYICVNSSWWIAVIGSFCMLVGYLYTGGPYPIAYTPFGELVSGIFMGLLLINIAFFIHTNTVTLESILVSVPISVLIGAILMANNIRDLDGDKDKGRCTLAILLGRERAITFLGGMFLVSYLWVLFLILAGFSSPWLVLVLLSAPKAIHSVKLFKGKTEAIQMMPAMATTAKTHTIFGVLLVLGLIISYIF